MLDAPPARSVLLAIAFCFMRPLLLPSAADDSGDGRRELQKAIVSLAPHPSTETYPVTFSVGGIDYRMPRNYLVTMENWDGGPQALVTVTVNLPDLKPLSQETSACFTAKTPDRPPGCEPFSFRINAPGGASADEAFERNKHFFESGTPIVGPSGFSQYSFGPPDARTDFYRKDDSHDTRLFYCHFVGNHDERNGLCQPVGDRVSTGAVIHFFFSPKHLNDIAEIDARLRKLVESFTTQSGEAK